MKLAVTDIRISAFNTLCATVDVEVEHGKSIYSACTIDVSIPLVDGKAINDYSEDLKNKAREVITRMYKEIVCGGEINEETVIPVCGKLTGDYGIKVANKNGKLSVAGLVGKDSDMLDLLRNEIKPSELSHESLVEVDKASAGGAIKSFLVEDGKIVMNAQHIALINSPPRDNLEERVALLEKRLEKTGAHTAGVNQESDGSLVVRDADNSVRLRMNQEQQTGLKVTVSDKDDVLWMRDSATQEGIMSLGYLKDGTQQKIIAALEDALFQTKTQLLPPRINEHFGKINTDVDASIDSKIERRYTDEDIVKIFSISADLVSDWKRYWSSAYSRHSEAQK